MLDSNNYYLSHSGRYVRDQLGKQLAKELSHIFGYYALEMGQHLSYTSWLQQSRIKKNIQIYTQQQQHLAASSCSIIAEAEFLPIVFDNIDVLISSHLLENSHYPQQILREIDRVLMPDGHCFLIGFNPFNYMELTQHVINKLKFTADKHSYHAFSATKITDWLNVLGFKIISTHGYDFRPAIQHKTLFQSLHYLESIGMQYAQQAGRVYLIHAQKTEFSKIATNRWQFNKILPRKPAIALASKQGTKQ